MFANRIRKQVEVAKKEWGDGQEESKALDSSDASKKQPRSPIKRLVTQSRTDLKRTSTGDGEAAFFEKSKPRRILSNDSYAHRTASQKDLEQTTRRHSSPDLASRR